ncbi:glycoside hydrolase [Nostocoides sp. F2B08]|uniref:endo alpha-1,4 polygalactosaminidase n=1 Tax=Nostocoides sp. F2B08 TaxID=2653936 RepID=UPI0012631DB4|nr:endo alpha-1,4 polygalactosaminidase [Tetrasphaera sp. F2B08]KAB7744800.1 glycoside hydrolase [Tetrasphaera sp. F2B08]
MPRTVVLLAVLAAGVTLIALAAGGGLARSEKAGPPHTEPAVAIRQAAATQVGSWVYQLQGYPDGRLDEIAASPHDLAVIDLARDAGSSWFSRLEVGRVRASGKVVLAYFEIGSIEDFRPEAAAVRASPQGLVLNRWEDWPEEHFVRYWEEDWWELAVRPRLDRALAAGFDGVYLDTPLAYEEIDKSLVPGTSRTELARRMVALIARISAYAKERRPGFWVVPQNSPELRVVRGYLEAIDGIGMEELFVKATDEPCTEDWCEENLEHTRAIRQAGKLVLAVDYADRPDLVISTCRRYAQEGFAGYVASLALDSIRPPCGSV